MRIRFTSLVLAAAVATTTAWAQPLDKRPFADVQRTFESGDAATRVEIAEFWGKRREQQATDILAKAASSDADAKVRTKSAWALGTINPGGPSAIGALRGALASDADTNVRYMAAWALGRAPESAAGAALVAATRDRDNAVRAQAARSLGELRHAPAKEALKALLRESAKQVRVSATVALQRIGVSDAEIRAALPTGDRGQAMTAEKKSAGLGMALGVVGAGLFYAEKPVAGAVVAGLLATGVALAVVGATGGAFDTRTICGDGNPPPAGGACTSAGLPVQESINPGKKNLFLVGAILAGGAWLTSMIWTPIAIAKYNKRIDEAKQARWEPFFELRADAKLFGATLRF